MQKTHANQLIKMVNHISIHSAFLGTTEICGAFVAAHINTFWTSEMRQKLVEQAAANQESFSDISIAAMETIAIG